MNTDKLARFIYYRIMRLKYILSHNKELGCEEIEHINGEIWAYTIVLTRLFNDKDN